MRRKCSHIGLTTRNFGRRNSDLRIPCGVSGIPAWGAANISEAKFRERPKALSALRRWGARRYRCRMYRTGEGPLTGSWPAATYTGSDRMKHLNAKNYVCGLGAYVVCLVPAMLPIFEPVLGLNGAVRL